MSEEIDRQEIAIRYLLGKLSAEEDKTRLEERYFTDDTEFEQLEIAEDELIDRYVRNELSAEDTSRFERLLVSPGLSERVEVARLIVKRSASVPQVETTREVSTLPVKPVRVGWWDRLFGPAAAIPAFRPALAMSMAFLLLTTGAFIFVRMKLKEESQRLAQEQQQREQLNRDYQEQKARYDELTAELKKTEQQIDEQTALTKEYRDLLAEEQQRSIAAVVFPIILNPGVGTRGPGGKSVADIKVPQGVPQVNLKLNVTHGGDDYARYNASVRNIDSQTSIATKSNLKPFTNRGRKFIQFSLNSKAFRPGSYSVHVDGITAEGKIDNFDDYPFRITSR